MAKIPSDFYSVLGINKDADFEEVRKAYLRAALRWHPDKNPNEKDLAEAMFKRVAQAYKVLSDDILRSQYNASGESGLGRDWWPDDPDASRDMAYQFFIHRVPGKALAEGFSEAKLREIFPHLFRRGEVLNGVRGHQRSPL
ncbi:dnajb6-a [Symbiodinium natans]|uniref:Dnajb6-a protein n=1 Tax=Symbiodinium natans TaxID=878477 RepID=A0A812SF62_9DINO|nr:dnajb6-a [Symbiodinium natans]